MHLQTTNVENFRTIASCFYDFPIKHASNLTIQSINFSKFILFQNSIVFFATPSVFVKYSSYFFVTKWFIFDLNAYHEIKYEWAFSLFFTITHVFVYAFICMHIALVSLLVHNYFINNPSYLSKSGKHLRKRDILKFYSIYTLILLKNKNVWELNVKEK